MAKRHCRFSDVEGFVTNTILRFGGHLGSLHDFDDLYQEAWIVFYVVRERYGRNIKSKRHFQALYQRLLYSRFVKLHKFSIRCAEGNHLGDKDKCLSPILKDRNRDLDMDVDEIPKSVAIVLARIGLLDLVRGRKYLTTACCWAQESAVDFVERLVGDGKDGVSVLEEVRAWACST